MCLTKKQYILQTSLFIIVLVLAPVLSTACFAQDDLIFREIGYDLNVDPTAFIIDAGGLVDVNADGWIDIFIGQEVCLNNGTVNGVLQPFTYFDSSTLLGECRFADYNNDGFVDAYGCRQTEVIDHLFRNEGGAVFKDLFGSVGIEYEYGKFSLPAGWADFDNDGWVDVVVGMNQKTGWAIGLYLWKNQEGTFFVDVAEEMGIKVPNTWQGLVWADFDNDNDQDLFVAGGYNGDMLFRNDGTVFTNITDTTGVSGLEIEGHSRSGATGDFNNDGRLDLFVCDDEDVNRLYRNDGDGLWQDVAPQLNLSDSKPGDASFDASSTAVWGDYDNDGDLDLFVSSMGGLTDQRSENHLYRNENATVFVEVSESTDINFNPGQTYYAAAFGDVDNDGDLDLYISAGPAEIAPGLGGNVDLLLENTMGNKNNWLEFRLQGVQSNRSAIGARIICYSDTLTQIREVQGGTGYNSVSPLVQHFGFGQRAVVDSVIVRWPSGVNDRLFDVPVNQIINLAEGITARVETKLTMPIKMNLEQNYPNPFNPTTLIDYHLDSESDVILEIFDVNGKLVKKLVDNCQTPGQYSIMWDGRNSFNTLVASGIYIYRLHTGNKIQSKKMIFAK